MTALAPDAIPAAVPPALPGLEPLTPVVRRWPAVLAGTLTVAMVAGLAVQLFRRGLAGLTASVPHNPLFYLCFACFYLALPVGDYLIFRKLWGIPPSGLVALLKKRIANDVLVNYSGEAYFYAWARQRTRLVAAPFGAVKDVSILSAMAGNAITLVLVAAALPFARDLLTPQQYHTALWSAVLLIGISLPFVIFSRRVFSLPSRALWDVFGIHCARVVASNVFTVLAWHFAMPHIAIAMWLMLAAAKMLVFRLPLIPNKEVLFPLLANMLIGGALVQHLSFFGALTLVANIVLLVGFGLYGLIRKDRQW
ncbi:hypothetical protein [Sphingomonas sp.]|uniref:hypothetical protein n=1 Tax=Sphingomonas sp. TaxID=28214 RepID=UPI003CC5656B